MLKVIVIFLIVVALAGGCAGIGTSQFFSSPTSESSTSGEGKDTEASSAIGALIGVIILVLLIVVGILSRPRADWSAIDKFMPPRPGYHRHHIVPVYEGGSDTPDNLVYLTPWEHEQAHWQRWHKYHDYRDLWAAQKLRKRRHARH